MLATRMPTRETISETRLQTGVVTGFADPEWVVDGSLRCVRAPGCLLEPSAGDTVLCCRAENGAWFVLAVLIRPQADEGRLSVAGASRVTLTAQSLNLTGTEEVNLSSLRHMRLNAALGTLHFTAQNLYSTIADTVVQTAQNCIARMTQYSLKASGLLRQHGRHQIVTADQDVRIDGERITMG